MGETLERAGVGIVVLGAILFVLPQIGVHGHPGPPDLWLYLLGGGAALFVLGRIVK